MVNFFIRDEEQRIAEQSAHMDDVDLIMSPIDNKLVVVAMREGQHVCQRCGEHFDPADPGLRGVEVHFDQARVLLHARCREGSSRIQVFQNLEGVQVRRRIAQMAKRTQAVADAAEEGEKKLIAG